MSTLPNIAFFFPPPPPCWDPQISCDGGEWWRHKIAHTLCVHVCTAQLLKTAIFTPCTNLCVVCRNALFQVLKTLSGTRIKKTSIRLASKFTEDAHSVLHDLRCCVNCTGSEINSFNIIIVMLHKYQ
jgi:hypothetical protein